MRRRLERCALVGLVAVLGAGRAQAAEREQAARSVEKQEVNGCRRLPQHRRIVRLSLKPETSVADLVAWISSVTCRQFVLPGTISATEKRVTVVSPQLITGEEAYQLFLAALATVGLTVQPSGGFDRVIESSKAKQSAIPFYGADGELLYDGHADGETASEATRPPLAARPAR